MSWVEAGTWNSVLSVTETCIIVLCIWYFVSHVQKNIEKPVKLKILVFLVLWVGFAGLAFGLQTTEYTQAEVIIYLLLSSTAAGHFLYNNSRMYLFYYFAFLIIVNIFFLVFMNLYILYLFSYQSKNRKLKEELKLYRKQSEMQYHYYEQLEHMKDMDMTTIFANLLDNAIEAAEGAAGDRYIHMKADSVHDFQAIRICNSYNMADGRQRKENSGHMGIGLLNVKRTLAEYGGGVHIEKNNKEFIVSITIPLSRESIKKEEIQDEKYSDYS